MKKFIALIALALLLLLSSCVGNLLEPKNDPTQFYIPRISQDIKPLADFAGKDFSINMPLVRIPAYMTRTQIITAQANSTRLNISDLHRWADIPSDSFTRVLAGNLSGHLNMIDIAVYPSASSKSNAMTLRVSVVECLGEFGGDLNFAALWEASLGESSAHFSKVFKTKVPAGDNYDDYTKAISKALSELSLDMATHISILDKPIEK